MNCQNPIRYGYSIIGIILVCIVCVPPMYAAEMSNEQVTEQLNNFFTDEGASAPSSQELRTMGILFIMTADLKDGFDNGEYDQISGVLNTDTYACIGADAKTDYFSKLFIFLKLLESGNEKSFTEMDFGDIMVTLGMAEESIAAIQPAPSQSAELPANPYKTETDPDAQIKAGLNPPIKPNWQTQYMIIPE